MARSCSLAGALAIIGEKSHHGRFLGVERLDGVAALDVRLEVDLEYFDANDA